MRSVRGQLRTLGFYKIEENTEKLKNLAKKWSKTAGTDESPFEALPSFITNKKADSKKREVLAIDIGGTSTKAAFRTCTDDGRENWNFIFKYRNEELKNSSNSQDSFTDYCYQLAKAISEGITKLNKPISDFKNFGFVWSNAVVNKPLGDIGITAVVTSRDKYSKNEWFIKDLTDGRDLGKDILKAFREVGFDIENLVFTNDTALTLKALDLDTDAGIVASTGSNGTVLKTEKELAVSDSDTKRLICNAEIGGRFEIPSDLFSKGDKIFPGHLANTIEKLSSGRFIRQIFTEHALLLDFEELIEFQNYLRSLGVEHYNLFKAKDLGLLIVDKEEFLSRRKNPEIYTNECLEILEFLASEVLNRAALLSAILGYSSIANLFSEKSVFNIALDSRLAREMPYFWERFQAWTKEITPEGKSAKLHLLKPIEAEGGSVSIPMIGVARALDSL